MPTSLPFCFESSVSLRERVDYDMSRKLHPTRFLISKELASSCKNRGYNTLEQRYPLETRRIQDRDKLQSATKEALENVLSYNGLRLLELPHNSHCLFSALSHQLWELDDDASAVNMRYQPLLSLRNCGDKIFIV